MAEVHSGNQKSGTGSQLMTLSALYLFIYYGLGAFTPLITQYYKSIDLSGTQIGLISAVTPIVSIVTQPLWGMICDKFQIRKGVLVLALLASGLVGLLFPAVSTFAFVLLLYTLLSVFQSAIVPVSDSIALGFAKKHNMAFGDIRMWGAVGFAVAAFVTGLLVQRWGPSMIFYSYFLALLVAVLFLRPVPEEVESAPKLQAGVLRGVKDLLRLPRFILFLIAAFFIFGSVNANNVWFSLYYQEIGGSVAGVGVAFLLFAGSEAPFMKLAGFFVRRWGLELTILLAGGVSAVRWFWYSTEPSTTAVLALFFVQGISVGFYLATAAQFVRENTPASLQVTALALFFSVGHGLGTMVCNLTAGIIKDSFSMLSIYLFFGVVTTLGLIPLLLIRYGPWKQQTEEQLQSTQ
ncbi:MFS transporter [Brevibacillus sp. TJ4]|uniref:MFS transporter n=1 Tax=Brevibacillus sp. TJ4 TaxID=3234853 RepID=UPI0037CD91C4